MAEVEIQLREATLDDVIGIVYVHATTSIAAYPNADYDISEADVRSIDFHPMVPQWQHTLQSPNYKLWVQARGDEILGFIAVRKAQDSQEIHTQYVLPEHQGKGLGRQLLTEAIKWLDDDEPISLRIASYLGKAIDFYKSQGFRVNPLAEIGSWRLPSGKTIPTVEMTTKIVEVPEVSTSPASTISMPVAPPKVDVPETKPDKPSAPPSSTIKPKGLVGRNELAKLSDVRASTIKHYTEIGLLPFEQKEARLARRYNADNALKRLEEIKALKSQGLSIPQIQQRLSETT